MPDSPPPSEKEIFLASLNLPDGEERRSYLDRVCGEGTVLRARVEKLLAARTPDERFPAMQEMAKLRGEEEMPVPGDVIGYFGEYLLLGEIARGGSGRVFRARQVSLNRTVALKMLRMLPGVEDEDVTRRFQAEAEAAATLDHPHIVPIYEVGVHEGQNYYSMKLVEGGTLASQMTDYQAEPRRAAALMVKICRAVHHAHQQAILHRDLKPGNILMDAAGEPHVADFGLARHMEMDLELTVTGMVLGTPHYMSPEQARGESRRLTVATDVYSLGAILYELMAGRRAFAGETMAAVLQQVTEVAPPPLRSVRPERDRDMETIVMQCLEKSPSARYGSAAALADDLERWLRGEPVTARAPRALERLWKWARRKPALAAAAGLAVLLALALVVSLAVSRHLVGQALGKSEDSLVLARQSLDRAEGRVSYMTTVLPDLLEPVGRLDLLDGPFRNVAEYYETMPPGARDAASLARHAAFLSRWSGVLWKTGQRRARLERLEEAAGLMRAALTRPDAGQQTWVTAAAVFRSLSDAREAFNDPPGAAAAAAEARILVENGLVRFPGEPLFAQEQARLKLVEIRRLRARGESQAAFVLAQEQAEVWRGLFTGAVSARSGTARECREATAEFYREWAGAAREADQPYKDIILEYEQRMAEALQTLPDDAAARSEHHKALSHASGVFMAAEDREAAARYAQLFLDGARKAAALDPGSLSLKVNLHAAEALYSQARLWAGDEAGEASLLQTAVRGLDEIQARDGALDPFVDALRANVLTTLAQNLARNGRPAEACDRVEQGLAALWRRTLARGADWSSHSTLDFILWRTENWLADFEGGAARTLPLFIRQYESMRHVTPEPDAEALWHWSRGGILRRLSRAQFRTPDAAGGAEQAWAWMEESHRLRLAAIRAPGARPQMLPQAAEAITAWLDTAPAALHSRVLLAAETLAGAIPAALRLGPAAAWRADWANAFARVADLMPAEAAGAFCRRTEQALFGQPVERAWTTGELSAQSLLKSKFTP